MNSFSPIYATDIFIKNPGVLTFLSMICDELSVYDRFLLYGWFLEKEEELNIKKHATNYYERVYANPEGRQLSMLEKISSYHKDNYLTEHQKEYVEWLNKYKVLFDENVLKFNHISDFVPSIKLIEYHQSALSEKGLDNRSKKGFDDYLKIDNFYWCLATSIWHNKPIISDSFIEYPLPEKRFDVINIEHYNWLHSESNDISSNSLNKKVDSITSQLATTLALTAFPEFPPLLPDEICKLRLKLQEEREEVIDSLRELSTSVIQLSASKEINNINDACQFIIDSKVMPAFRRLRRASEKEGSSEYKSVLRRLLKPAIFLAKVLDPTEPLSKWDILKETLETTNEVYKENSESKANKDYHSAERITGMFILKMSKELKEIRPMRFK